MRITIASRIFSPEPSAASYMLEAIARAFRDSGHEVTVLTTRPGARPITDIPGVTVRRAPVLRDSSGYVRGYLPYLSFDVPLAFRLLFSRRADLYFVEPPPTTGAVVRVITWLLRRPYFYDAADIWSDAAKLATSSTLVLRMLRWVELFALRGAAHAFTISPGLGARMRELGVHTPTTVIGFGVDADVFQYTAPATDGTPYFLYAGTYSEWHGADVFVEAFARFSAAHPGYRLLFVGNGTQRHELEALRDAAGLTNIEFLDPISGTELTSLFASATASLSSLKPGQGYDYAFTTKVYSSIAAGCPVVFTGVGPTTGFIREASAAHAVGEAIDYDVELVAEAMARLAANPVQPAERRALSDWARSTFSLDAIASTVVARAETLRARR